ncbi:MAG: glycosyltransferase family 2 protein [Spirochaetae bacterium HGW-Spirochaetae-5]|nr:MAG: glycosyltransferase family 2 protein [Spirochaetae bacterium HGW-Spirochaetae-5]
MKNPEKIYIILVNYNGWKDTIECLESILHNNYKYYQIIVCDNASTDDSLNYIKQWAEGKHIPEVDPEHPLTHLLMPIKEKPLQYSTYSYESLLHHTAPQPLSDSPLILIDAGSNLGFAGGNNAAIKFAQLKNDFTHVWILNNDTVIENDSLEQLVKYAHQSRESGNKTGIIGSKLLYYNNPDVIQAVGGIYYRTLAYSRHIGSGEYDKGQFDNENFKKDYVIGASLFVSKEYINDVGPMCEDYFIYFEETDWITRGNKRGWKIGYTGKSRVYHKEGASTGANKQKKTKSSFAVYHFFRSALIFTWSHYPLLLMIVIPRILATILYRILKGDKDKVNAMITALTLKKMY